MNHDVAVNASAACSLIIRVCLEREHTASGSRPIYTLQPALYAGNVRAERVSGGVRAIMAFFTQEWRTGFQQGRNVGAVRNMAVSAIFGR